MKLHIAIAALILGALAVSGVRAEDEADREVGLVVFKLGEKYATDKQAGEAIDDFTDYLDARVNGVDFERRGVRNDPAEALKLFKNEDEPVGVAIVSPGFYFTHKDDLKLKAIAEATRGGKDGEQYTLVGADKLEGYPGGKRVATSMTLDKDWLDKVVLRRPEDAEPVKWVQYDNLMDAGYAIIDGEDNAPDYVLVDRITLGIFEKDLDLKTLKQGTQSEVLPQDLVVEVDESLGKARDDFKKTLRELDQTKGGKKLGELLQSPKFPAPDEKRLKEVQAWYDKK